MLELHTPPGRCHWHFMGSEVIRQRCGGFLSGPTEVSLFPLTLINDSVYSVSNPLFFPALSFFSEREIALCFLLFSSTFFFYVWFLLLLFLLLPSHQHPIANGNHAPNYSLFASVLIRKAAIFFSSFGVFTSCVVRFFYFFYYLFF